MTNELWSDPNLPAMPMLVNQGGNTYSSHIPAAGTYPRDVAAPALFTVDVEPTFSWDDAVLVFPIYGDRAAPASVPLGGEGKIVALAPRTVSFHETMLDSGAVHLTMLSGFLRTDTALDVDLGNDPDWEGHDTHGLDQGKAGLKLYFSFEGSPGAGGFNFGAEAFTLQLPNGRVLQPDNGPILAVYPENKYYSRLAIATQVDLPATGTYTLTMVDGDGPPDSVTFTVS